MLSFEQYKSIVFTNSQHLYMPTLGRHKKEERGAMVTISLNAELLFLRIQGVFTFCCVLNGFELNLT